MFTLGIDIGGTFTDLVLRDMESGRLFFGKTLTTYPDPTAGILTGVRELMQTHHKDITAVQALVHGTTLITNAVIERKGVKTGLLTTAGFEDVLEIGREMRYDIYDIFITMPQPLVPATLRLGVEERIDKKGNVITPLSRAQMEQAVDRLVAEGVEAIAVCYLHSYANPEHERLTGAYIASRYPAIALSLSSAIMPEIREYERTSATAMNAYVQPIAGHYLSNLRVRLQELGYGGTIHIMNSAGRLTTLEGACHAPIQLLESGPAGGTMAGVFFGKLTGQPHLVAFDMGGTTAKASMIRDLSPEITRHFEAAREKRFKKGSGLPVRIPVIDMIEIGAGGGSIARVNHLGILTVGPESASSTPGPACYGRGGTQPTVTDADLVLGFLNEQYFLGGTMPLDTSLARKAIQEKIADPLGISVEEAAWGIHRLVNENMANAARVHILEKGLDPRFFSMMAFGGAGPVHAFHVARLMHAPRIMVPAGAGVLSALGFLVSPVATEEIVSYISRLDQIDWPKLDGLLTQMKEKGLRFLADAGIDPAEAIIKIVCDMRYAGQGHEISVSIPFSAPAPEHEADIRRAFDEEYRLRYGRTIGHMPVETVTWRVLVSNRAPEFVPEQAVVGQHTQLLKGHRPVYWSGAWLTVPVYDRYQMPPFRLFDGPCIIEEFESTTVVGPGSRVSLDAFRNIIIDLLTDEPEAVATTPHYNKV